MFSDMDVDLALRQERRRGHFPVQAALHSLCSVPDQLGLDTALQAFLQDSLGSGDGRLEGRAVGNVDNGAHVDLAANEDGGGGAREEAAVSMLAQSVAARVQAGLNRRDLSNTGASSSSMYRNNLQHSLEVAQDFMLLTEAFAAAAPVPTLGGSLKRARAAPAPAPVPAGSGSAKAKKRGDQTEVQPFACSGDMCVVWRLRCLCVCVCLCAS